MSVFKHGHKGNLDGICFWNEAAYGNFRKDEMMEGQEGRVTKGDRVEKITSS